MSNNQWPVLPRRVADAEAATSNLRHCWRRVCLPARQCIVLVTQLSFSTVGQFISPDVWPANSPDLKPCDYYIQGMMQVYGVPIRDTDKLGKRLVATWAEFQQSVVDDAVDQW